MGLCRQVFQFDDEPPSAERVAALLAEDGQPLELVHHPPGFHVVVDGLNVPVLSRGEQLEVVLWGIGRLTRGWAGRAAEVRRALVALGGRPRGIARRIPRKAPSMRLVFSFDGQVPSGEAVTEEIARRRRKRREEIFPWPASDELWVGRHPVTIRCAGHALELECMLGDGAALEVVGEAAVALGGRRARP